MHVNWLCTYTWDPLDLDHCVSLLNLADAACTPPDSVSRETAVPATGFNRKNAMQAENGDRYTDFLPLRPAGCCPVGGIRTGIGRPHPVCQCVHSIPLFFSTYCRSRSVQGAVAICSQFLVQSSERPVLRLSCGPAQPSHNYRVMIS